jgi:hypothetical protein
MKKPIIILFFLMAAGIFAQQNSDPRKFALVIGNSEYTEFARLKNPMNDANDMAAALHELGFTVDKVIDGSLDDMERAIERLKNRLSGSRNTYGFFFYAGHGVQSNGMNYLIPVGANISGENYLRERAVSVQTMLAELNDAGNDLNIIVLDACRDNPFDWARERGSGSRGLTVVPNQPADSILVYATSAGSAAADGEGRNGLFTTYLLKNLKTPGLEVSELFRLTGADVKEASGQRQTPAIYNQFFGKAYLGRRPIETPPQPVETATPVPMPQPAPVPQPVPVKPVQPAKPVPPVTPVQPVQPDKPEKKRDPAADKAARLNSLGVSFGTTFSAPWFVTTVSGTIAPSKNSFFDIGIDLGIVSEFEDVYYYSFYPFAHYAVFVPFKNAGGWYAGAGAGFMLATYQFPEGEINENTFAVDIGTGIIIKDIFNISYTLRTNFESASNKISVGFIKRF